MFRGYREKDNRGQKLYDKTNRNPIMDNKVIIISSKLVTVVKYLMSAPNLAANHACKTDNRVN